MSRTATWITPKGKTQEITLTEAEQGALAEGDIRQTGYTCFVDLYATYEQTDHAMIIVGRYIKQPYLIPSDHFIRNGHQVHRVFLTSKEQEIRLSSLFFNAWNHCQRCHSFRVSFYANHIVFCHDCRLNRRYRPHAPGGVDATQAWEPQLYALLYCPRWFDYEDAKPIPEQPSPIGYYNLYRHRATGLVYRPSLSPFEWRDNRAMFYRNEQHGEPRVTHVFFDRDSLELYAVNQPIYT